MTTQYTTILKLALPVQGELSGTWGDVVNDNITQMVEQAVAGKAVVNTWTGNSHTLTTADGTTSESRCAILELTDSGTALTGAGTVVCPTNTKLYIVDNNTAQIITVKTSGGTGVAVPVGKTMLVYCDGTNVVEGVTHANSMSLGTSTVTADKILDEDNMASDSATAIATQQSIKAYVDSLAGVIADGSVTTAKLADDAVTAAKLASDAVVTASIVDDAVTAAKLASDAVVTASIVDDAVTAAKLASDAVVTASIVDDAVTAAKLASNAVVTASIVDANVTTAKIADDAVTAAKIASEPITVGITSVVTATSLTATVNTHVYVSAATQTITLPASPAIGQRVLITVGNFTDTVVARNGSNIMSSASDFTMDAAYLSIQFIYTDATQGWVMS